MKKFSQDKAASSTFLKSDVNASGLATKSSSDISLIQMKDSADLSKQVSGIDNIQRKADNFVNNKNSGLFIQTKMTVGSSNDKFEKEADHVASFVVEKINAPEISRKDGLEEEETIQAKFNNVSIQRKSTDEGGEVTTDFETEVNNSKSGGKSLDNGLQSSMSHAMGSDFSSVKIHTDSNADKLSRSIQAKAFTTGQDLFFSKGAYNPQSKSGQELIAHELTHVVQQGSA
jgi:hypothetical protein